MSVFLVSEDRVWSHELISTLGGLSVEPIFTTTTAGMRFRRSLPTLLLVDLFGQERGVARMLRDLRQNHPAAQVPVFIFTDEAVPRALRRLSLAGHRRRTGGFDGLEGQVNQIIKKKISCFSAGNPHPYALDVLGRVWREELSGELSGERSGKIVEVAQGGLLNPGDIH